MFWAFEDASSTVQPLLLNFFWWSRCVVTFWEMMFFHVSHSHLDVWKASWSQDQRNFGEMPAATPWEHLCVWIASSVLFHNWHATAGKMKLILTAFCQCKQVTSMTCKLTLDLVQSWRECNNVWFVKTIHSKGCGAFASKHRGVPSAKELHRKVHWRWGGEILNCNMFSSSTENHPSMGR